MKKVSLNRKYFGKVIQGLIFTGLAALIVSCQSEETKRPSTINLNNMATKVMVTGQDSDAPSGRVDHTIMVDTVERHFFHHLPENLKENQITPLPVVFVYHGQRSSAAGFYRTSGWKELGESEEFLTVYPQAYAEKENDNNAALWDNGAMNIHFDTESTDVVFFREMYAIIDSLFAIDKSRVYITGLGAGGGMAMKIAMEAPELATAIGVVSGLDFGTDAQPEVENVVSCLMLQGRNDPLLLWKWSNPKPNAAALMASGAGEQITLFRRSFGFSEDYSVNTSIEGQYALNFSHNDGSAELQFILIEGLRYGYPGAKDVSAERNGVASTTMNAAELFWAFFSEHTKTSAPIQ
ncbi:MAG: PHB depolymerase family esterase [Bacteroidota bacterium]